LRSISIRVEDEVKERLDALASAHQLNLSAVLREAIVERLEELEDFYEVSARLARPHRRLSNAEVWAAPDLAD
jgi:predicted DNA-binding protein